MSESVLIHTYPHKPMIKIKVTICNHQADYPHDMWIDVWSDGIQLWEREWCLFVMLNDPYWDQASLKRINATLFILNNKVF